ncbi:hypothetical protein CcaverHIS002_0601110 [Cutaneotrichosporon cavernicola]|uniref:Cyclin-dependent kinases regulatory subunit n=1 Tax=Cutaneotrichosporon cavernicola TaxID=279322 RepID=A0AA48QWL5_9TREE|nr:uncharacterized protein CcaverHIS019_0501210 [Cutaneotrichosporon cavernicola]BEI85824.1 hypothetical protein CcaverHIS002_0601110 [Cutaneotrichosporon cavernicola]BEI92493.1 hypothetical protein CcaverHIS019_0501210 [Cutaneotrichosporon cavernicola]BEJ00265.1 hypothetical protein CcaverHIS631_0501220 [Cutaneotrichosporon cavernicola]BEJ08035.1 hypothetical protein CcaverHIS641_0501200 [Cutaneotrichosporon cavernicola]
MSKKSYSAEEKRRAIEQYHEKINYSARYSDDEWEYRHVILPKALTKFVPSGVLSEDVWRGLGIRQSPGWEMYMRHEPEPHVLLFRRPKDYDLRHPPLGAARLVSAAK